MPPPAHLRLHPPDGPLWAELLVVIAVATMANVLLATRAWAVVTKRGKDGAASALSAAEKQMPGSRWIRRHFVTAAHVGVALALPLALAPDGAIASLSFGMLMWIGAWKLVDVALGTHPPHVASSASRLLVHFACPVEARSGPPDPAAAAGRWALAVLAKAALLCAALLLRSAGMGHRLADYVDVWVLFLFLSAMSDAFSGLLSAAGHRPVVIFRAPLLASTSPKDFWSRRWNLLIHGLTKRTVFLPLVEAGAAPAAAATAAFLCSGLFHEYVFGAKCFGHRWTAISEALASGADVAGSCANIAACAQVGSLLVFFAAQGAIVTVQTLAQGTAVGDAAARLVPRPLQVVGTSLCLLPLAHLFTAGLSVEGGGFDELQAMVGVVRWS